MTGGRAGFTAREAFAGLRRNLGTAVAAVLCVAVSLTLVGMALMARQAVDNATQRWQDGVEFIVFLDPEAGPAPATTLDRALAEDRLVERFTFLDQEAAFREFTDMFADTPDMVEMVTPDILPASFRVAPVDAAPDAVETLVARYQGFDGVLRVARSTDAIATINSVASFLTTWGIGIAGVLAVAAMLMIATTVQLAVHHRRRDIQVMQLVGAPRYLVQAPFVAEGAVFGLAGAALAAGAVRVFQPVLDRNLPSDAQFPLFGELTLANVSVLPIAATVLVLGVVAGATAAAVAVAWFTRRLQ